MAIVKATARTRGGKKLKQAVDQAKRAQSVKELAVGFFNTARYPDGTAVTNVAAWNEFGTRSIPERPFFRQAIKTMKPKVDRFLERRVDPKEMVVDRQLAGQVGELAKAEIQTSIRNLHQPPNSPVTIRGGWVSTPSGKPYLVKGKGSSNPLIDTGFMRISTSYQIKD